MGAGPPRERPRCEDNPAAARRRARWVVFSNGRVEAAAALRPLPCTVIRMPLRSCKTTLYRLYRVR